MSAQDFIELDFRGHSLNREGVRLIVQSALLSEAISALKTPQYHLSAIYEFVCNFYWNHVIPLGTHQYSAPTLKDEVDIVTLLILLLYHISLCDDFLDEEHLQLLYHISSYRS